MSYAYTTLITRASYLAGVVALAATLRAAGRSTYPLVVLYTDALEQAAVDALALEAPHLGLVLARVDALNVPPGVVPHLIAERFADTWTKLRVFDAPLHGYARVCYLDADMTVNGPIDGVFKAVRLPGADWLAANHACVCNLDGDPWAPADWTAANCAYTPLAHPAALTQPTPVLPTSPPTHHLLNSGMFLFAPSPALWRDMYAFFSSPSTPLATYKFPDQDFLAEFFRNRWVSVGWQYNALKTMRYWHPNIWRDDAVVVLHYIVDKPWAARPAADGTAGYKGRDGVTHGWWWAAYGAWQQQARAGGRTASVAAVARYVAGEGGDADGQGHDTGLAALGSRVQAFAHNKAGENPL